MNEGDPENREHWVQIITTIPEILSKDHSFNLTTDKRIKSYFLNSEMYCQQTFKTNMLKTGVNKVYGDIIVGYGRHLIIQSCQSVLNPAPGRTALSVQGSLPFANQTHCPSL